jgi:AcrR family transcriptional regulator
MYSSPNAPKTLTSCGIRVSQPAARDSYAGRRCATVTFSRRGVRMTVPATASVWRYLLNGLPWQPTCRRPADGVEASQIFMSITLDAKCSLMYLDMDMKKRAYEMRSRGVATAITHDKIINAAIDTFMAERSFAIALGPVAERAGVTVKTVLRHFGNRDALIEAAWSRLYRDVMAERAALPGDREGALSVLIAHYERRGDMILGVLAEEDQDPRARRMCDTGRIDHRQWMEEVFGAGLPERGDERCRLVDALVVATDVYSWKLLRVDRGLSVDEVRDRMRLMTEAFLAAAAAGCRAAVAAEAP